MPAEAPTLPQLLTVPLTARFAVTRRPLKIAFAITICSAGAFGIFSESAFISSSNTVVSAYIVDVRSPIDGAATGLPLAAGTSVLPGQLLATVDNPRSDPQHLDALRSALIAAQSTVDALTAERATLQRQHSDLLSRAHLHTGAVRARLQQQTAEAERTLAALQLTLNQATTELRRARELNSAGILANSEFDRVRSAQLIAAQQLAAQQSALNAIRSEATDAAHGILSGASSASDVSYSRQRADELEIKLTDNAAALAAAQSQAAAAALGVQAESVRGNLLRHAEIRSPIGGVVWKLNTIDGESATAGSSIASIVDCNRQFILAQVPQERLPDILSQGDARIRLSGESVERSGTVLSIAGDVLKKADTRLAAVPVQDSADPMGTVLIALSPSGSNAPCAIGRSARVLIPTRSSNLAARWLRDLF